MQKHMDVAFLPSLYLDRDKKAIAFIEDRLLHYETCAAVCMYGNGKDYLFSNVVRRLASKNLTHKLQVLNTVSADELKDFAATLERETEPTICLVNLRIGQDVSWFIQIIERLRVTRGHAFVSFINSYVGDVYTALQAVRSPITHSLVMLKRIPFADADNILAELSDRFDFYPSNEQKQDIYHWSRGHVGLLRTLYLLKRQTPGKLFTGAGLLREPTVLERLSNVLRDLPAEKLEALRQHRLSFTEKMFFEAFGYIDSQGDLFHPLLAPLLKSEPTQRAPALSPTEARVLEYLQGKPDTIVSREDIAKIVWGEEEWQDKYSDWAIGQLIYRVRKKLEQSPSTATIQTRKSQGFVYAA